jgi:hAT family C-terminal dimerisation region
VEPKDEKKKSEFESYVDVTDPIKETKSFDPITWWQFVAEDFPTFHLYALDTLSCPTMSTECERAFSSVKKLLTPERNALSMDIIEACECLKTWWKNDLPSIMEPGRYVEGASTPGV